MSLHVPQAQESSPRGTIFLSHSPSSAVRAIGIRVAIAVAVLCAVVAIVYLDRDGYRDAAGDELSVLDAFYYATVSLSTTGYGDITPITDSARLINVLVITPLRILFLIVLVGTTLEALTYRSREAWRVERWRNRMSDHVLVVGFGVKGRSTVNTLLANGVPRSQVVVVDPRPTAIAEANEMGLVGVVGDATRSEVLRRARADRATKVVIAPERDDTAVLVTLTARSLSPTATIIVSVREEENADIVRHSGADSVITSSESVGRLLGLATVSPHISEVLEDLLSSGSGLEVAERRVVPREEGLTPEQLEEPVLAVLRDEQLQPYFAPGIGHLVRDDRVVVVRPAEDLPWTRRVEQDGES